MLQTIWKPSLAVCGLFWGEKQFLLIFVHFYWFDQKQLFKQIQIFFTIFSFSNLLRKTNFLSISVLLSEIVTFLTKQWSFQWISPQNASKQQRSKVQLFVAHFEEKYSFCLYLSIFTAFNRKGYLQQIQIFLRIFPFSNLLRKLNFLSISVLLSKIGTFFLLKREVLQWISPKMLQNNRNA